MKNNRRGSCNKKSCGCNSSNSSSPANTCSQFKQLANEKCDRAERLNCQANKVAQQAVAAEQRAEALKRQAIEECQRANELWDQYNQLADEGICLMQQAQACLAKSVECYSDLYEDVEGCNIEDFGGTVSNSNNSNGCNCECCHR